MKSWFKRTKKEKNETKETLSVDGMNVPQDQKEEVAEAPKDTNTKGIFSKISQKFKKGNSGVKVVPDKPKKIGKKKSTSYFMQPRMSLKEQSLFAKRMSFLIKAGVPILESLHIMKGQMRRGVTTIFETIITDISEGKFLHTSLSQYKRTFGDFTINIIKVGETSGALGDNFAYLSEELKKRDELKKKVIGSLVYPVFITIATVGVATLLTAYIFPKVMPIFSSLDVNLPWTTRALIAISDYLQNWGIVTFLVVTGLIVLLITLHKTVFPVKKVIDRILLRLPIIGKIMKNYNVSNFCRTLGILLKGGMTVTSASKVTGDTIHNALYKKEAHALSEKLVSGKRIADHLELRPALFPDIATHMIAIGEKTGNLSDTLLYLADAYEHEVDDMTKNLSSSIEPVLMVFMGLIVGFVAVSVITPIYEVTKSLQR